MNLSFKKSSLETCYSDSRGLTCSNDKLEDEGSTPVLQPRTQTYMTDPLITELEVRRALDGLNPHKGAGPDGLFP